MPFIEDYLAHTNYYESCTNFWRWSAYTAIAGALRDSCYRRFGDRKLYPNIYTLLLAKSAVQRKGPPVELPERLIKDVNNTKIISGRGSIQGILDELARGETDKTTGKIITGGSALFFAPELSAGIVNDPDAIKILTDIYDFKEEYISRLRGSGVFRIKNICFSMLVASNEELLKDVYNSQAIYGGLLGRTFIIKPDEFRPGNSLFDIRDTSESYKNLLAQLSVISKLQGEFEFSPEARKVYDDWYLPFRQSYKDKSDNSGIAGRIHASVLKLAMIICVNDTLSLNVDRCHIQKAIEQCVKLLPNYVGFTVSSGKASDNECGITLIEDIWTSRTKTVTKSDFLSRHFHQFDLDILDKCVAKLRQAELLTETIKAGSADIEYGITRKCIVVFGLEKIEEKTKEAKTL